MQTVAAITQQVIVEFVVEDSQVETAAKKLQDTGKIDSQLANSFKATTAEINKQAQAVRNISVPFAPLKKNFEDTAKSAKNFTAFMEGFAEGIMDELNKAGITLEEFMQKLIQGPKDAEAPTENLKSRLKQLTQQIAAMKLANQDNNAQFFALVKEAGEIKDALEDASAEIKNFASDSQLIDNILGSFQALAGGIAAAQGAVGLFSDDNEALQKTLLKVNSALALAQGIQQVTNALQKEGALTLLAVNIQQRIKNAQQIIDNALTSESIIVRAGATIAQKALNAAMAANPIGIVIVGLTTLITLLEVFGSRAANAAQQTNALNAELKDGVKAFEGRADFIRQLSQSNINALQNEGAVASRIAKQEVTNQDLLVDAIKERITKLSELQKRTGDADLEQKKQLQDELLKLNDQLLSEQLKRNDLFFKAQKVQREEDLKSTIAITEARLLKASEGSETQLKLQKQLLNARTALELNADGLLESQRNDIIVKSNKERLELEADYQKRKLDLQGKQIETQLVNVEEGSQKELNLKLKQLKIEAEAEATSTKLSEDEKKVIRSKAFEEQLKLQRLFNERIRKEAIEAQISLNTAQIDQLKTNDEDKLLLQISNIELAAQLEIDAAKNNAAKIKEITSKRDADILATKKQFLESQLDFEISLEDARRGSELRALQRTSQDQRKSFDVRKAALIQISNIEIAEVDKRLAVLEDEKNKKLISEKDYQLKYAQLQDQKKKISEDTEQGITELTKQQNQLRLQTTIQAFQAIGNGASQLSQALTENNNLRISEEKDKVKALLDAGAITEKEANNRNKRIEAEERRLNREAAQRDKAIGIFQAVINTADAVTKALASAPPPFNVILAGIAGALGAVQIGVIANRPLPKLRKGKNRWSAFEGLAEVGEAGTELVEKDSKKYLVDKSTVMYIGKKDIVYTPEETNKILMPQPDKRALNHNTAVKEKEFDYDKMAEAIAGKITNQHTNINIDEDGFHVSVDDGISRKNYMDRRYSSKT